MTKILPDSGDKLVLVGIRGRTGKPFDPKSVGFESSGQDYTGFEPKYVIQIDKNGDARSVYSFELGTDKNGFPKHLFDYDTGTKRLVAGLAEKQGISALVGHFTPLPGTAIGLATSAIRHAPERADQSLYLGYWIHRASRSTPRLLRIRSRFMPNFPLSAKRSATRRWTSWAA